MGKIQVPCVPIGRGLFIGFLSGIISSIGGLGGPVVMMPLYFLLMPPCDMKVLIGITGPAASAMVTVAMVTTVFVGKPDYGLGIILAITQIGFSLLGGYLQERMASE